MVDSQLCAFLLTEDKKIKYATLREYILANREVSVKTLQRLAGKIYSFCIAVPAALLYARDIFRSTAGFSKSSCLVRVTGALRKEIEHWRFLDSLAYLNDDSFNFCQRCGFRKDPVIVDNTRDLLRIDIKDRVSELRKIRSDKPCQKQKSSTHRELVRFLASLPTSKSLSSASPGTS